MMLTSTLLCATLLLHICSATVIIVAEEDLLVDRGDLLGEERLQAPESSHFEYNDRPIIGVLSQELDDWLASKLPPNHNYTAYIASRWPRPPSPAQLCEVGGGRGSQGRPHHDWTDQSLL